MANITDLNESWNGHTHQEVETFVKSQLAELSGGQLTTLAATIIGGTSQTYAKDSKEVYLSFSVQNFVNGQYDTNWSATFYIIKNSTSNSRRELIGSTNCTGGDENTVWKSPNLANYLTNSTDNIIDSIVLEVSNGEKTTTRTVRFTCIFATLEIYNDIDNLNLAKVNRPNIRYVGRFSASDANLSVKSSSIVGSSVVDYSDQGANITSGNPIAIALNNEANGGVRKISAVLNLNGGTYMTNTVDTEAIFVTPNEQSGTFIAIRPILNAKVHEDATVEFGIYSANRVTADARVDVMQGETVLTGATINCRCGTLTADGITSSYTFNVPAEGISIRITCNGVMRTYDIEAEGSSVGWEVASDSEILLNAKGKANNQADKDSWENNGYSTEFKNFDFNTNGWNNSESLHLTGDAEAKINIAPLYDRTSFNLVEYRGGGFLNTGRTITFKIKSSNVSKAGGILVDCWDPANGGCGFYVRPDSVYVKIGQDELIQDYDADQTSSINNRRFAAETETEFTISVESLFYGGVQRNPNVRLYVNGEIAGVISITTLNTLSQSFAKYVTFKAEGANLDVYYLNVYNRCLSSEEIHHNYVMMKNSQVEMMADYTKNNYNFNSFDDAVRYCKDQSLKTKGNCSIVVTTDIRRGVTSTSNVDGSPDFNQLWVMYFKNGEVDVERSIKYVAIIKNALRIRVQGTSTASMPEKNLRYDGRVDNGLLAIKWNPNTGAWYEDTPENRAAGYVKVTKKIGIVINSKDDIPCTLLTTKTNYNESTATRNLPNALWVNDACNALYDNYPERYDDLLTPPQKEDRRVRQTINGVPALQYYFNLADNSKTFTGKVDIITDKSNQGVFGFNDEADYSIELRSNTTAVCNFHTSDLTNACQLTEAGATGNDDLEFRYPDATTQYNAQVNGKVIIGPDTPMQRLWDLVMNCSPYFVGYEYHNGVRTSHNFLKIKGRIPYVTDNNQANGVRTYTVAPQVGRNIFYADVDWDDRTDTIENRKLKWYAEAHTVIIVNSFVFNGLVSRTHLWTDQRAKNQFFTHFAGDVDAESGNEVLRLLPYDIDTSWRGDNDSRLRYDFTRTYEDKGIYDDAHAIDGVAHGSTLWYLMDECFGTEYNKMYFDLLNCTVNGAPKNFYSYDILRSYYKDNQVEAYNASIYNADTDYKYLATVTDSEGTSDQRFKAHGSAIEDLDWWMQGRLYFIGGQYYDSNDKNSLYAANSVTINVRPNHTFGDIELKVSCYVRNYTNWLQGTAYKAKGYSEAYTDGSTPDQFQTIRFDNFVTSASDARLYLYGYKQVRSLGDLSQVYIVNFESSDTLNFEDLIVGSEAEGYENDVFMGFGNAVYGSCKEVNVANCTNFANANFRNFPVLEKLNMKGCSKVASTALPSTSLLKEVHYPANMTNINITNKPNMELIDIEGVENITEIEVYNTNNVTAQFALSTLASIYNV